MLPKGNPASARERSLAVSVISEAHCVFICCLPLAQLTTTALSAVSEPEALFSIPHYFTHFERRALRLNFPSLLVGKGEREKAPELPGKEIHL